VKVGGAIARMLDDQSGSLFLKVKFAYWNSELECRWRGKDGEGTVGREGSFKLLIYINNNIR